MTIHNGARGRFVVLSFNVRIVIFEHVNEYFICYTTAIVTSNQRGYFYTVECTNGTTGKYSTGTGVPLKIFFIKLPVLKFNFSMF